MTNHDDEDLRGRIEQIEALIEEIERHPDPAAQELSRAVVQAVLDFHGAALANLIGHVASAGPPGRAILDALTRDDLVANLLLLHGLHPDDLETRVAQALDRVRPQLHAHGGDVALLGIDGDRGIVRLRLQGSCHGCPSSTVTLTQTIEAAIHDAAPEVAAIEVEGMVGPPQAPVPPLVTLGPLITGNGGKAP